MLKMCMRAALTAGLLAVAHPGAAKAEVAVLPMPPLAAGPGEATVQRADYYWRGAHYPYRWRGGYYTYQWRGGYYRHRRWWHGYWRYY
jgi:hypothetical protein